jgi:hypothetical protein
MRYVAGCLVTIAVLFGGLSLGMYLIFGDADKRGVIGLMLLTAVAFFLQHRSHSEYERFLAKRIYRLEEQVKLSAEEATS